MSSNNRSNKNQAPAKAKISKAEAKARAEQSARDKLAAKIREGSEKAQAKAPFTVDMVKNVASTIAKTEFKAAAKEMSEIAKSVGKIQEPESRSWKEKLKSTVTGAVDWISKGGWQDILAIGAAFLLDPENERIAAIATDNVVPAGTVLKVVPIKPNFFGDDDNIAKFASMYTFFEFGAETYFEIKGLTSSENANGAIAAFINTDPTLALSDLKGSDMRQVVEDYRGVTCRLDKTAKLYVPKSQAALYTNGDDTGIDPRFTTQGVLYIVAFTDLDLSTTSISISMNYNMRLGKSGDDAFRPVLGLNNTFAQYMFAAIDNYSPNGGNLQYYNDANDTWVSVVGTSVPSSDKKFRTVNSAGQPSPYRYLHIEPSYSTNNFPWFNTGDFVQLPPGSYALNLDATVSFIVRVPGSFIPANASLYLGINVTGLSNLQTEMFVVADGTWQSVVTNDFFGGSTSGSEFWFIRSLSFNRLISFDHPVRVRISTYFNTEGTFPFADTTVRTFRSRGILHVFPIQAHPSAKSVNADVSRQFHTVSKLEPVGVTPNENPPKEQSPSYLAQQEQAFSLYSQRRSSFPTNMGQGPQ